MGVRYRVRVLPAHAGHGLVEVLLCADSSRLRGEWSLRDASGTDCSGLYTIW